MYKIKNSNIYEFIFYIFVIVFALKQFSIAFEGDGWRFVTPFMNMDSGTFDYWSWIFTHEDTQSKQFIPISWFVYPFFVRMIFGGSEFGFNFVTYLMIIASTLLLYRFVFIQFHSKLAAFIATTTFLLHDSLWGITNEISDQSKYLLPLIALLLSLHLIQKSNLRDLKSFSLLLFLQIFAILSHEASISFFPILWAYYIYQYKSFNRFLILQIIPPIISVYLRVFIFKFKTSNVGVLQLKIDGFFDMAIYHFQQFFSHILLSETLLTFIFTSIVIISVLYLIWKNSKETLLMLVLCMILGGIIISPFFLAKSHFFPDRNMWSLVVFVFFLGWLFSRFNLSQTYKRVSLILFSLLFMLSASFNIKNLSKINFHYPPITAQDDLQYQIEQTGEYDVYYIDTEPVGRAWILDSILPGILANRFPDKVFHLSNKESSSTDYYFEVIVYKGSYYKSYWKRLDYEQNKIHNNFQFNNQDFSTKYSAYFFDPWGRRAHFSIKNPKSSIRLKVDLKIFKLLYPIGG